MSTGYTTVAAIDFGTINIGCAFSLTEDCQEIYSVKIDGQYERVENTVLLNRSEQLDSIGIAAKEKFINLVDKGKHGDWYLFEGYKLFLHKDRLTRDLVITDCKGKTFNAINLFRLIIERLKCEVEKAIAKAIAGFQDKNIKWVITVPAIWSDSARQFMREAAVAANIDEEQLQLCLEPEAAALYCLQQPNRAVHADGTFETNTFKKGEKYIILDIGGGTADICVHEVLDDNTVREIHRAIGNLAGGNKVNDAFEKLMGKAVGFDIWEQMKSENISAYLELMSDFEKKKKIFEISQLKDKYKTNMIIRIPFDLQDKLKIKGTSRSDNNKITFTTDKLCLQETTIENLFRPIVDEVVNEVKDLLKSMKESKEPISTLLVAGGFSESKYVQQRIQSDIPDTRVIYAPDGSLAVMKGAVLMGFRPRSITERRARYTYGFEECEQFMEGTHPESLKYLRGGEILCCKIFSKMITKGQVLRFKQKFCQNSYDTFRTKKLKEDKVKVTLYRSTEYNPKYCTEDEGCFPVGTIITIDPPDDGWNDHVTYEDQFIVGETEFKVSIKDLQTGRVYDTKIDFL